MQEGAALWDSARRFSNSEQYKRGRGSGQFRNVSGSRQRKQGSIVRQC